MNVIKSLRSKQSNHLLFLGGILVLALILAACGGGAEEEATPVGLDNIVAATPTQRPTATPVPTIAPTQVPTETPTGVDSTNSVVVALSDDEEEEAAPAQQQPLIEPQVVSINFRQKVLNDWIEVVPPPGWILSEGVDGIILSKDPAGLPTQPFVLVRRWGNAVNTGDWVAYLPDGFEERDSNVTVRMGGFDWEGIFVTNAENSYRAFFAVNNDSIPAYTVLVYVPFPDDAVTATGTVTREDLTAYWETEVGDLNTILRRFLFS